GAVPLDPRVREGGDDGDPAVLQEGFRAGEAFREVTANVADNVGIIARRRHADGAAAEAD
nr:MRP family ATP-binding protein [Actinomycetota bacterium]